MHVYLKDQFIFLIASFFTGVFLSILYDVFRILRVWRGNRYLKGLSPEKIVAKSSIFKLYNSYSSKRNYKKKKQKAEFFLVMIEDVFYSAILVLTVQILVFGGNRGVPRFFSFAGLFLGFFLSRITVGNLILFFSEYIIYFVGAVIYYLLYPLYFLLLKIKKVIYKLYILIYNRYVGQRLQKKSKKQMLCIKKMIADFSQNLKWSDNEHQF